MASINATNTNTSLVKEYRTLFDWRKKRCILHADVEASCTVHSCLFLWSSLVQQASIEASSGDRGFTVLRKFSWEPQGHKGLNRIWIWSESPSILGNSFSFMQMNQCPKSAKKHVEMQMIKTLAVMLKFRAVLSLLSSTALPCFNQATAAALCASPSQTKIETPKKKQENKNHWCSKGTVLLTADSF